MMLPESCVRAVEGERDMTLASCGREQPSAPISDAIVSANGRALRAMMIAVAAASLCFFAVGTTRAHADGCRTAADEAELAKLEKELDSLHIHRSLLETLKAAKEEELAKQKAADNIPVVIDRLTKKVAELDAALKENAARKEVVKARISVLQALKPCPPENKTPPAKTDEPGKTPPVSDHPCRTPEDDKTIAALKAKKTLYTQELKLLERWIRTLGGRYQEEQKQGLKEQLASTDRQLTEYGRWRGVLEGEIRDLENQIAALYALKPCAEESKTTPGTSGTTPGTKHPKKAVKHGKHAVSEDNPLYMENYKAPAKTRTSTHQKSGDEGEGPSQNDVDRETEQPSNDDRTNQQPDIPIPH
jgi:hypothetical protein